MQVGMMGALLVAVAMSAVANAQGSGHEPVVASSPVLDDRYPRVTALFDDEIEGYPDLVYAIPPGFRPLRLDLYKPRKARQNHALPLVIYVHGGGWQSGHTRHSGAFANWPQVLASLAARGYVVASIEYRLSGEARFPAAIEDVKTSIRWLRAHHADFGIDRSRAVIWGGSAGGHLAALAATTCGVGAPARSAGSGAGSDASARLAAESDCVQGLVAWYGVFDFSAVPQIASDRTSSAESPIEKFLGCRPTACESTVTLASPIKHVDERTPSTLLIHGELDKVVPASQSRAFHAALAARGVRAELVVMPAVDHSFIGPDEAATRSASLAALSRTFTFIDATLRGTQP